MRYRILGGTGIEVSAYCLGTMMLGKWGNTDHAEGEAMIHAALDAGINFIDTADVYSAGESEEIVGKAIKNRRDEVVLATKVNGIMGPGGNNRGNSRRWIRHEVEQSLRRLDTDWIDLYQIHRPDPRCDIEETLSVLSDLVHEGKVRAIGCSTFPPESIVEAHWAAERRGLERFRCEQPPYSLLARGVEAGVLPVCERYAMGVIAWSPLAGGWLSGKYRQGHSVDMTMGRATLQPKRFDPNLPANQHKMETVGKLEAVATEAGMPLKHLAMSFVVSHPAVTAAIIGPRTMDQLQDLLAGSAITLDDATLDRLDEIVPPGTTVNEADAGWQVESITQSWRRRRPLGWRAAAE
jgi:aryl-alcohol dehydrogenase-like predicted oxidoreductase